MQPTNIFHVLFFQRIIVKKIILLLKNRNIFTNLLKQRNYET